MNVTDPTVALYPGSFDPITRGHEDIVRRALRVADRVIVGVARTSTHAKRGLFSVEEEVMSVKRSDLPRTSEGSLASDFGMAPMMVVTAVPHGGGGGLRAGARAERDARQRT